MDSSIATESYDRQSDSFTVTYKSMFFYHVTELEAKDDSWIGHDGFAEVGRHRI